MECVCLPCKDATITGDEKRHVAEGLPEWKKRLPETLLPKLDKVTLT